MVTIIRSAIISGVGRPLRRPGMAAAALGAPAAAAPVAAAAAQVPPDVAPPCAPADAPAPAMADETRQLGAQWARLREREAAQAAAEAELAALQARLAQQQRQLEQAQQALTERCAAAQAEAEQRGLAQGREQAGRDAAAQVTQHNERVNAVIGALNESRRRALDEQEDMLVEIVFAALCRLVGTVAATGAGVEAMVRQLLAGEREAGALCVRLHPHDLALLTAGGAAFDPGLSLRADDSIEIGGCLLESPRGTLDARLEVQLAQLRAAMLALRAASGPHEAPV